MQLDGDRILAGKAGRLPRTGGRLVRRCRRSTQALTVLASHDVVGSFAGHASRVARACFSRPAYPVCASSCSRAGRAQGGRYAGHRRGLDGEAPGGVRPRPAQSLHGVRVVSGENSSAVLAKDGTVEPEIVGRAASRGAGRRPRSALLAQGLAQPVRKAPGAAICPLGWSTVYLDTLRPCTPVLPHDYGSEFLRVATASACSSPGVTALTAYAHALRVATGGSRECSPTWAGRDQAHALKGPSCTSSIRPRGRSPGATSSPPTLNRSADRRCRQAIGRTAPPTRGCAGSRSSRTTWDGLPDTGARFMHRTNPCDDGRPSGIRRKGLALATQRWKAS